ncbi:hypothetical protein COJ90_21005 [Priestia megaterium]|uniref:deaminase domain-containing protein n=1 Tax=Priestia megaterium TaxID=1404 RepID=UPI000BF8112B|nr:deaminase domain-containing protein [Priestia megaterium]PFP09385.1 hypothetical protein COJ90_21005 [Priestia megaterium]
MSIQKAVGTLTRKKIEPSDDDATGVWLSLQEVAWEKDIEQLRKDGKITRAQRNRLLNGGNFATALIHGSRKKENREVPFSDMIFASSRISYPSQHQLINHTETSDFYEKMVYKRPGVKYYYSYIPVDTFRNITNDKPRCNDSEAKILEEIRERLINKVYEPYESLSISLYTALEPCLSCDYAIIQFLKEFPDINLTMYSKWSYNETIYPRKEK